MTVEPDGDGWRGRWTCRGCAGERSGRMGLPIEGPISREDAMRQLRIWTRMGTKQDGSWTCPLCRMHGWGHGWSVQQGPQFRRQLEEEEEAP